MIFPFPTHYDFPIPISPLCLTSHFMCAQFFHMVSIDVPAGVGAPPLNTATNVIMALLKFVVLYSMPKFHDCTTLYNNMVSVCKNIYITPYILWNKSSTLYACWFDGLEDVHHTLSFQSLQLGMDADEGPSATNTITE